ncbi:MAG: peptide chain release factor N(5)-glutamine methyltransferase [Planctomycetota bacterium]
MNSREILQKTAPWLKERGAESARLDAEILLAHVLECDRVTLYTDGERPLIDAELDSYRELVRRRARGEPVAYLVGQREFYGLPMAVTPDVLIPRPETEAIVDRVRELEPATILDLCTGSGCIAIACAVRLPEAQIVATDVSAAALEVARGNAQRHEVEDRVRFEEGDLFAALDGDTKFDLIVANPPYVSTGSDTETTGHEPDVALFAGASGLDVIERILAEAPKWMAEGATLLMEIGEDQQDAVLALAGADYGAKVLKDLAGHPRIFEGQPR